MRLFILLFSLILILNSLPLSTAYHLNSSGNLAEDIEKIDTNKSVLEQNIKKFINSSEKIYVTVKNLSVNDTKKLGSLNFSSPLMSYLSIKLNSEDLNKTFSEKINRHCEGTFAEIETIFKKKINEFKDDYNETLVKQQALREKYSELTKKEKQLNTYNELLDEKQKLNKDIQENEDGLKKRLAALTFSSVFLGLFLGFLQIRRFKKMEIMGLFVKRGRDRIIILMVALSIAIVFLFAYILLNLPILDYVL